MTETNIDDHLYQPPKSGNPRRKWQSKPQAPLIKGAGDNPHKKVILGKLKEVVSQSVQLIHDALITPSDKPATDSEALPSSSIDESDASAQQSSTSPSTQGNSQNIEHYKTLAREEASKEVDSLLQDKRARFDKALEAEKMAMLDEIEAEKKRGYEDAFKKGFKEGRSEGVESLKVRSEELTSAINDIFKEKNQLMVKSKEQILKLSLEIAKQVISTDVSLQPAVSMNIVEEALKRVTDKDHVVLRLNPLEANWIRSNKAWLEDKMKDIGQLIIQDDDNLEMGGCIIETKLGFIDASLKTKLQNIEASFLKLFEDNEAENNQNNVSSANLSDEISDQEEDAGIEDPSFDDPQSDETLEETSNDLDSPTMAEPGSDAAQTPDEPTFDFDDDFDDDDDFDFDDLDLD